MLIGGCTRVLKGLGRVSWGHRRHSSLAVLVLAAVMLEAFSCLPNRVQLLLSVEGLRIASIILLLLALLLGAQLLGALWA